MMKKYQYLNLTKDEDMDQRTSSSASQSYHAPAERLPQKIIQHQSSYFTEDSFLRQILDAMPNLLSVLNGQRQIIFSNQALLDFLGAPTPDVAQGLRPGELFGCLNAQTMPGGCGTAETCRTCGAVNAILASIEGRREIQEYRLTRKIDGRFESLDLQIHTTPFEHRGERFTLFTVQNISDSKRRSVLEKIFFHDILNLAGGVQNFAQLLAENPHTEDRQEILRLIDSAASQVVEEINAQRTLLAAESRELKISASTLNARAMVLETAEIYRRHPVSESKIIEVQAESDNLWFVSDSALLGRVLGNMVKNALEACRSGDVITLGCRGAEEKVEFWVHNPGVIPRKIQLQLFQRSFSTKGGDRGLGTYSMRLLTEGYLQGQMAFSSKPEAGTIFRATYPLELAMTSQP